MISDEQLAEWKKEYEEGYEKAYKCIPDLIEEVEKLRAVAEAAEKSQNRLATLAFHKTGHGHLTCVPSESFTAWLLHQSTALDLALKAWRGDDKA